MTKVLQPPTMKMHFVMLLLGHSRLLSMGMLCLDRGGRIWRARGQVPSHFLGDLFHSTPSFTDKNFITAPPILESFR